MASQLKVDAEVFVPAVRLGLKDQPSALYRTKVLEAGGRSIRVRLPSGDASEPIGTSLAHDNLGVTIISLGDYDTEDSLLAPLAKSILQYLRLLVSDDSVVTKQFVRSVAELRHIWDRDAAAYSHVVLIGHGRSDGLKLGVDGWVGASKVNESLSDKGRKIVISLACQTGVARFARPFSQTPHCSALIAPFHDVHSAVASQFCQAYFAHHFLDGRTPKVAFNLAAGGLPGRAVFRFWSYGKMRAGAH